MFLLILCFSVSITRDTILEASGSVLRWIELMGWGVGGGLGVYEFVIFFPFFIRLMIEGSLTNLFKYQI